jgi:hypothetical protein
MRKGFGIFVKIRSLALALATGLALIGSTSARASSGLLDFTVPAVNPGASISFAGGANPLVGTGITITDVEGVGTPLNDLVTKLITGGVLTFTSGNLTGSSPGEWDFGAGAPGGITIKGGIASLGIAGGSTLLTGQIESASVVASTGNFKVAISDFVNIVNPTLAAFYGNPSTGWSGNFNIGFSAPGTSPGTFTSTGVSSGDVITSIPEPSSFVLGCIALGTIGYGLRRRKVLGA